VSRPRGYLPESFVSGWWCIRREVLYIYIYIDLYIYIYIYIVFSGITRLEGSLPYNWERGEGRERGGGGGVELGCLVYMSRNSVPSLCMSSVCIVCTVVSSQWIHWVSWSTSAV
jgi:hypothetical protein